LGKEAAHPEGGKRATISKEKGLTQKGKREKDGKIFEGKVEPFVRRPSTTEKRRTRSRLKGKSIVS